MWNREKINRSWISYYQARRVALLFSLVLWVAGALANECNVSGYDKNEPSKASDTTAKTDRSFFEWTSDVDPYQGRSRGWHYIRNLHDRDLSLRWDKPKLVISFDHPLPKTKVFCKYDYGDTVNSYARDDDAPVYVPGDGEKGAVAYVKSGSVKGKQVGASIETSYRLSNGEIAYGSVLLIVRYYKADRFLELEVSASPIGTGVAFNPDSIGVSVDTLSAAMNKANIGIVGKGTFGSIVDSDELVAEMLDRDLEAKFIVASGLSKESLRFSDVEKGPRGRTPMLLISPDGEVVAATYVDLTDLEGVQ